MVSARVVRRGSRPVRNSLAVVRGWHHKGVTSSVRQHRVLVGRPSFDEQKDCLVRLRRIISTIDAHAGGQPLRIITSGVPRLPGATLLERRAYLRKHHDDLRRLLLHEPRGHSDMYGAVLTEPSSVEADYGVIFMTNEGYSTMCGHGVIALTTALIETGTFPDQGPETRITYDTPAGLIQARATVSDGRVRAVRFRNVPAFRLAHNLLIRGRWSARSRSMSPLVEPGMRSFPMSRWGFP